MLSPFWVFFFFCNVQNDGNLFSEIYHSLFFSEIYLDLLFPLSLFHMPCLILILPPTVTPQYGQSPEKEPWWTGFESAWRTFLMVQWIRIYLQMQGTWVWSQVWEDSTCHGMTKPVCHYFWAWPLEPTSHNYGACEPQLLKLFLAGREVTARRSLHTAAE